MKNKKRFRYIISVVLHAALLLVIFMLQGGIFPYLRLGGLVPLLFPIVVTGIALYEGRYAGGIYGLFSGILCDISFNQPIGVFTVFLTVIGIAVGILSDTILLSGFVMYYICNTVVQILCAFVQMTPIIASPHNIPTGIIFGMASAQIIYSLIMAFPIWFAVRALSRRIERAPVITGSGKTGKERGV